MDKFLILQKNITLRVYSTSVLSRRERHKCHIAHTIGGIVAAIVAHWLYMFVGLFM